MNYLTSEQVLFLHARLTEETGGEHGLRDLNLLLSALGRPQASYDGEDLYPDLFSKAAALMDSLIRNHPFLDGNKRIGIAATGLFLMRNEYQLTMTNREMESFTLQVAKSQKTIEDIIKWLETNSYKTA